MALCASDVRLCPDGTFVSRNASNACNFDQCPIFGIPPLQDLEILCNCISENNLCTQSCPAFSGPIFNTLNVSECFSIEQSACSNITTYLEFCENCGYSPPMPPAIPYPPDFPYAPTLYQGQNSPSPLLPPSPSPSLPPSPQPLVPPPSQPPFPPPDYTNNYIIVSIISIIFAITGIIMLIVGYILFPLNQLFQQQQTVKYIEQPEISLSTQTEDKQKNTANINQSQGKQKNTN